MRHFDFKTTEQILNGTSEEIEKYGIYKITVYRGDQEEYRTYCTPEAKKAIDAYLEYRLRSGEVCKRVAEAHSHGEKRCEKNERHLDPDAPLFREQFDRRDSI